MDRKLCDIKIWKLIVRVRERERKNKKKHDHFKFNWQLVFRKIDTLNKSFAYLNTFDILMQAEMFNSIIYICLFRNF